MLGQQGSSPFANYDSVFGGGAASSGGPVFGGGSAEQVDQLQKALAVGYAYPPVSGADALRMESLDNTLHVVTFSLQNIKLWPAIPKKKAWSTVESYDLLTSYGDGSGIFTQGGELPQTQDSGYVRKTQQVKFCGIVGEVTHPTTLVQTIVGDLIALETQNKSIRLVQGIESALFNGRSDVIAQEWDGLEKQILDGAYGTTITPTFDPWNNDRVQSGFSVVVDLRGGSLTEDLIEYGANQVVENYDVATDLHLAPRAASELTKTMYPRERINLPAPNNGTVGFAVNNVTTSGGNVRLNPNVFLRAGSLGRKNAPTVATNVNAPNAPTAMTCTPAADGSGITRFAAGDAGTYTYSVTAVNRYGESAPFTVTGVSVASGNKVTLAITDGGGANPATGYNVYRTAISNFAAGAQILTRLPKTTVAGTGVFVDFNFYLPGTSRAFLIPQNDRFFAFRQLCPMVKVPLATIAISIRWAMLLYGTPIVYETSRCVMYTNVKDA